MADLTLFALLNTGLLGVYTHKLAMDVTAHNVANANTPGYSRQRPEVEAMPPIPMTTLTQPSYPLQIGTGSRVRTITRVRDQFLDIQYRQVNNRYNFWDTMLSNLHFIEQLFSEPGENGIRYLYDMFWAGIQDVITDPTNVAAKQEMVSRAKVLVQNVKDLYSRIEQLRDDINSEIKQRVDAINSMLHQIAVLNNKIRIGMVMNSPPNDLMDKRDLLLDKLSEMVDIHYRVAEDGQVFLRIGDQLVVNGGTVNEIRYYERPYGKGYYELFVGNSKLSINDGKLKALIDLRDNILVKYLNRLDEFVLFLTDKVNLIHRDGFTAQGTTNLDFFQQIVSHGDDPAIFRILGSRKMVSGPIKDVTGLHNLSQSTIENTPFTSPGKLLYMYDDQFSSDEININSGDRISDITGTYFSDVSDVNVTVDTPNGVDYRLHLNTTGDFSESLLIDVTGTVLKTMGLPTTTKSFLVISEDSLSNLSGVYQVTFKYEDGTSETININTTDLSTIENSINTASGVKARRYVDPNNGKEYLLIIPTSSFDFNWNAVTIEDPQGFFTAANSQMKDYVVLAPKPTLENITGHSAPFTLRIGATPIQIDPTVDTLENLKEKINSANVGVIADITPHGRFVLRAGRMYKFDLRNVQISGPKQFFEELGLIEDDGVDDWGVTNFRLIDVTDSFTDLRNRMDVAEFLTFDRTTADEPIRVTNQFNLSSTVEYSPENVAVDIGKVLHNNDWNADNIIPTGQSNTVILQMLSQARFERLLDDGKVSLGQYFGSVVAEMGVEGELANKMKVNNEVLRKEIDNAREMVKGVSLDEEMANMIKYQHAFNAASRVITAVDEMIGRIIDRLGVVGR